MAAMAPPDPDHASHRRLSVIEQPDNPPPPSFGENNRNLPDQLKEILTAIVKRDFKPRKCTTAGSKT